MDLLTVWRSPSLSGMVRFTHEPAHEALAYGLEQTTELNRWVDAGTLLGIVRDKKFIAHDTDIDIAIATTPDDVMNIHFEEEHMVRTVHWAHLPMQFAYLHSGIIVDLYFYYRSIRPGFLVNVTPEAVINIPDELITTPLANNEWEGLNVPIPTDVDAYLTWTYGDWRTPRTSKSGWTADRPHLQRSSAANEWVLPGGHEDIRQLFAGVVGQRNDARAELKAIQDAAKKPPPETTPQS